MLVSPHTKMNRATAVDAGSAASPRPQLFRPSSQTTRHGAIFSPMQLIDGGIAITPAGNNRPSWKDLFPPEDLSVTAPLAPTFELAFPQSLDTLPPMSARNFYPFKATESGLKGNPASR